MSAPRSPGLDTALLLLAILQRIPRGRYTTSTALLDQLQAAGLTLSRRSLQRHLDTLTHHFPLECDTRSKPYGYRWTEGAQGINLPLLSAPEALLLQLAKTELADLLPTRTLKTLAPLFGNARQQLDTITTPAAERRWLKKTRRIPESLPLLPPRLAPGVFDRISDALYEERTLQLTYHNAQGSLKHATVWPLGLVPQGVRLYLVCRFAGHDNQRILALARITEAQLGLPFTYPTDFDLDRYIAEGHFGVYIGPKAHITFRISKPLGQHLVETPLSADQQQTDEGEHLRISATVVETELLHRWLRSWGDDLTDLQITLAAEEHTP